MARAIFAVLTGLLATSQLATGLQVSPNSPCADVCVDSIDDDISDPSSSTTKGSDITCQNDNYLTTPKGKKFKECMECLQGSTYSQGSENDQMWFLYNLRYTFDHCVYAFGNATGIDIGPCATSAACGPLQDALTSDDLDASQVTSYGYCDSSLTGDYSDVCLDCVSADGSKSYLANFLVALQAGCLQKPAVGQLLGLNDTVFADTGIEIADGATVGGDNDDDAGQRRITPQMIIGIVVGILALLAIIVAFLFIRHRKRRARMVQNNGPLPGAPGHGRSPVSPLSFRCETQLSPVSSPALFTSPQSSTQSPYMDEKSPVSPIGMWGQAYKERDTHQLRQLTRPTPTHQKSQTSIREEELTSPTPASAVSTKSTSNLLPLRPYNPSEYAFGKPHFQAPSSVNSSPSLGGWSPVETRKNAALWDNYDAATARSAAKGKAPDLGIYSKKSQSSLQGSPVETKEFKMNFSAPPRR